MVETRKIDDEDCQQSLEIDQALSRDACVFLFGRSIKLTQSLSGIVFLVYLFSPPPPWNSCFIFIFLSLSLFFPQDRCIAWTLFCLSCFSSSHNNKNKGIQRKILYYIPYSANVIFGKEGDDNYIMSYFDMQEILVNGRICFAAISGQRKERSEAKK